MATTPATLQPGAPVPKMAATWFQVSAGDKPESAVCDDGEAIIVNAAVMMALMVVEVITVVAEVV